MTTLAQPVLVTANVLFDLCIALKGNGAGDHIIKEGTIVADQNERSVKVHEQLFEKF